MSQVEASCLVNRLDRVSSAICAPQETQLGSACGTGAPPTVATHVYSRLRARTFQLCVKYPPISPHPIAPWCSFSSLFRVAAVGGVRTFTVAGCTYVLLELVVHSHHSYNPFLSPPFVRVLKCPPPPHHPPSRAPHQCSSPHPSLLSTAVYAASTLLPSSPN